MQEKISRQITRCEGLALIEQFFKSGLKAKAFCMQQNLSHHVFYYWRRIYKKESLLQPKPVGFLPLKVAPSATTVSVSSSPLSPVSKIYFKPNIIIEVPSGFDKTTLQNILEVCQQCG